MLENKEVNLDMEKPSEIDAKYWEETILPNGIICWITKDGLLYKVKLEAAKIILKLRPYKDGAWWFNNTFDRMCGELHSDGFVRVNPNVMR